MGRRYKSIFEQTHKIYCYDNGGKSADRYTVVYLNEPQNTPCTFNCLAMSAEPFHPQGVGMHNNAMTGRHLGERIMFAALPIDCQKIVKRDLEINDADHYKGLAKWATEYKESRHTGNVALAKQLRDSIKTKITEFALDATRVWGNDPDAK